MKEADVPCTVDAKIVKVTHGGETYYALQNLLQRVMNSKNTSISRDFCKYPHCGPQFFQIFEATRSEWPGPSPKPPGRNQRWITSSALKSQFFPHLLRKQADLIEHHPDHVLANDIFRRTRGFFEGAQPFIDGDFQGILDLANVLDSSPEHIKERNARALVGCFPVAPLRVGCIPVDPTCDQRDVQSTSHPFCSESADFSNNKRQRVEVRMPETPIVPLVGAVYWSPLRVMEPLGCIRSS